MSAESAAPPVVETDAPDPIEVLRREHADALREWRELSDREHELEHGGTWTSDGRDALALSEFDRAVLLDELRTARPQVARRVQQAASVLQAARVERANDTLARLVPEHATAAESALGARQRFEDAWLALVIAGWELAEAANGERVAAAAITSVATDAAPSDEVREAIRYAARHGHTVPASLGPDGPDGWQQRPELRMFGGEMNALRSEEPYVVAGRLIRNGRKASAHVGGYVRQRLEAVEAKRST
jgi:hypothetical protein